MWKYNFLLPFLLIGNLAFSQEFLTVPNLFSQQQDSATMTMIYNDIIC